MDLTLLAEKIRCLYFSHSLLFLHWRILISEWLLFAVMSVDWQFLWRRNLFIRCKRFNARWRWRWRWWRWDIEDNDHITIVVTINYTPIKHQSPLCCCCYTSDTRICEEACHLSTGDSCWLGCWSRFLESTYCWWCTLGIIININNIKHIYRN